MEFELQIREKLPTVFASYKLDLSETEKEAVLHRTAFYVYNLVFNLCALISTITSIYDPDHRKVKPKYLDYSLNYVTSQCFPETKRTSKTQKGGSYHIDSDYFGSPSPNYSTSSSGTVMDQIQFPQVARPGLLLSQKGGEHTPNHTSGPAPILVQEFTMLMVLNDSKKEPLFGNSFLRKIFKEFDVSIKDSSLEVVRKILKMHLTCFLYDLKEQGGAVTVKKIETAANLARHNIFT